MNIKNNQFWFWGFIVLAVILISAVTTMAIHTYSFHNNDNRYCNSNNQQRGQRGMQSNNSGKGLQNNYNFTTQEKEFFRNERQQHQQKLRDIKSIQKRNHNKLFKEIIKKDSDNDSINKYKEVILESNTEIIEETINYYETLKTGLSEEQMKMVNKHVSRRFKRNKRQ